MTAKLNGKESNVFFSEDNKSGILIQPRFRRVLFFVAGVTKDTFYYEEDTKASEVDRWITEKRKVYLKEKASIGLQPEEA